MLTRLLNDLRRWKAGLDMLPGLVERIEQATSEIALDGLLKQPKYASAKSLVPYRQKFFSQHGQDGIITEIFRRIGPGNRRFVEIGTAPLENNTGNLLLRGWSGLWVDGTLPPADALPQNLRALVTCGRLALASEFITRENIADVLAVRGFANTIDLLSVDIDRNTYHVLEACLPFAPRVISAEYNGQLPADIEWVMPYDPAAVWDGSTAYGASLKSLEILCAKFGYALVGCELSGTDAFFVRNDLLSDAFDAPFTAEHHWEPLRMTFDRRVGHRVEFPPLPDTGKDA